MSNHIEAARPEKHRRKGQWFNRLPDWIRADPNYRKLKASKRATMQFIAHACDRPDQQGDLWGAFITEDRLDQAGIAKRTFWSHLGALENLGFVVLVNRGGGRLGNVYSIPGAPRALDEFAVERRTDPNGKGGARPTFYDTTKRAPRPRASVCENGTLADGDLPACEDGTPPAPNQHATRAKMARVVCQISTLPSPSHPLPIPSHTHRDGVCVSGGKKGAPGHDGFQEFWTAYPNPRKFPRRQDRPGCLEIWKNESLGLMKTEIVLGLNQAKRSPGWTMEGGRYIPAAAKFLSSRGWESHLGPKQDIREPGAGPTVCTSDGILIPTRAFSEAEVARAMGVAA